MSILTVKNISHGFGDRAILEDVSFRLLKGEHVGLIGANGEGKSTFMNIITDNLMPDEGQVIWSNNVRVGYMDQHGSLIKGMTIREALRGAFQYLFDLETEMNTLYGSMGDMNEDEMNKALERTAVVQDMLDHNGFYIIDAKVEEVAKGLGLLDLGLDKDVSDLSDGQRTKILLGKLLLQNPVLNSVINLIYHIENRRLTRYVGDYNEFQRLYQLKKAQLEAAYDRQQKEIDKLEDFVARNKANVATANMAKSRQKKLDKIDRIELTAEKPKPQFNFKQARAAGKMIFETKDLVIGYDEPLTKPLNLYMERGQKIALVGANGLGKSTLLKSLLGQIKPVSGQVELGDYQYMGYFEQEIKELYCLYATNQSFIEM
ncbi:putative ABC transporter ATP-binding protein YheS [Clostridium liquoris]|uniref:Putative ABC transporter ATP-binding protein YheS n=1 Tax=Clostridium liquoris TaxID=1289519 RepID=A0A2T0B4V3_9CLOT|nr:putative ABC transporter ATP-binding protein YheS [Clostridium liquoris]